LLSTENLAGADPVHDPGMLDPGKDVAVDHPVRGLEGLGRQEAHCLLLAEFGNAGIHRSILALRLPGLVHSADDRRHVAHVPAPLDDHLVVQLGELAVVVSSRKLQRGSSPP
jgi:hypothetical protein